MFKKNLITSPGEIACRVVRTAKKMSMKAVAVHPDSGAPDPYVGKAAQ